MTTYKLVSTVDPEVTYSVEAADKDAGYLALIALPEVEEYLKESHPDIAAMNDADKKAALLPLIQG